MKMKTLLVFYLTLTFIVFNSCFQQDSKNIKSLSNCSIDAEFEANFKNCVLIAARIYIGDGIPFYDRYYAINCLEAITGYESLINKYGDSPYLYLNSPDSLDTNTNYFLRDLHYWHKWFEANKCKISFQDAKRLIETFGKEELDESLHWPGFPPPSN